RGGPHGGHPAVGAVPRSRARRIIRDVAPGAEARPPPPVIASGRVWLASLGVWIAVAALGGTARYAWYFESRPLGWWQSLAYSLADALVWAGATPPPLALRRFPRLDRETWPRLPLHLGVAIVLPVLLWFPVTGLTRELERAFGHSRWAWEVTRDEFTAGYLLSLVVCAQVLGVSQALVFHRES